MHINIYNFVDQNKLLLFTPAQPLCLRIRPFRESGPWMIKAHIILS